MFGSTWGNTQQTPQQPQQTGAFGQPSAFGAAPTNNAFGSTSAFGQTQQPQQGQQPQVNPMFGNIGSTPSTNTNTGAFGAFGGTNTANSGGAFGVKPATGFGAFGGGTSAFGGGSTTGAFGQPATNPAPASTSVFGQPATTNTTSAFGGGGSSLFGGSKFGTTSNVTTSIPTVTTGTSNPMYNTTSEKDGTATLQYQSISCMPAYVGYSFEELRVQDYAQNRKTASTTGAFGQTAFGAAPASTSTLFGAQPTQPGQSLFTNNNNNNTTTSAFGAFGQPAQPAAANPVSAFGGTGAFGQPAQQPAQTSAFGTTTSAFGQPAQQPQQQTSIFGGGGTSAFGATANKPAFGAFGGGGGTGAFGGTSAFGAPQQPAQQQTAQTTNIFGTPQPAANTQTSAFGAFGGTNNAAKPSIFGTPATTQPTTSAFGAFGQPAQQPAQPQQNAQPSIFGGGTTNLFGQQQPQQNQQQQQPAQTTSLFGGGQTTTPSLFGNNTNTNTGLFGNNQQAQQPQQQPQQQQAGNLFGNLFNKPAQPTTSLFGGGQTQTAPQPQQQTSLFGNFGQSNNNSSLFGAKPAPALGGSLSTNNGMSTTLFGGSVNNGGASLTASINQPIGENLPIFSMLPPGPRLVDMEQSKRQAGFFTDLPTRSPVPKVQLGYTPASSKLRGFGPSPSLTSSTSGNSLFTSGKSGVLSLNKTESMSSSVGPDFLGRSGSPALGTGGRHSVKKVILEKKTEPIEMFVKSGSPGVMRTGKVTFSPALSIAAREKDAEKASGPQAQESPTPVSRTLNHKSPNRFTAPTEKEAHSTADTDDQSSSTELGEGDYWMKPDLATLKKSGFSQLAAFEGLVVGRKGYGEIHFLQPVDLTGLGKLSALLGEVVRFDDKECSVYPESEEAEKPPPGSGLNVESKISLERCWAVDKATREPLTDLNNPIVIKHLKRLKNMKATHYIGFDMKTGTWTFTVDHF